MKKLNTLLTAALVGLSFNSFGQDFVTSYSQNNENRLGDRSVFIGELSGMSNTGTGNVFVGLAAGALNTTGDYNIFTGPAAGFYNVDGSNNIFTGYGAGYSNSSGNNNIYTGYQAGYSASEGANNIFTGQGAGYASSGGAHNTFTGYEAGYYNIGNNNIFSGFHAGRSRSDEECTGSFNIFTGHQAGYNNSTGSNNIIMGRNAGRNNYTGSENVFIGNQAGGLNRIGNNNVSIGARAGFSQGFSDDIVSDNNVFIGQHAGYSERGSSKLYIDASSSTTSTPLIYGDFALDQLTFNAQVNIGGSNATTFPENSGSIDVSDYKLFVEGGLLAEQVLVSTDWADYVFEDSYKLKSLNEVETFINENGHLPNVPSAKEVEASGIEMGEITKIQQEKIEELTLYLIQQEKEIEALKQMVNTIMKSQK